MTLEEAIKHAEEVAEENQRVIDTGIVFDDVTIDMLYCDDTEVIEEHLANYQRHADEHRQLAKWLKDYKRLLEHSRWLPVSERLPEKEMNCLVTDSLGKVHTVTFYQALDGRESYFSGCYCVIAWMPLPEPYEAESEE